MSYTDTDRGDLPLPLQLAKRSRLHPPLILEAEPWPSDKFGRGPCKDRLVRGVRHREHWYNEGSADPEHCVFCGQLRRMIPL